MRSTHAEERDSQVKTGSQTPLYTTEILRLAASLKDPRPLSREDGIARVRSPTCGSRMETSVELDSEGRVEAISQLVLACAFGQASAAVLEQGAVGRNRAEIAIAVSQLDEWLGGSDERPSWPGIDALAPARSRKARHGAILLPFRALLAALDAAARE
jgi:NifU-like protein involved in Fe-S cluster formation